MAKKKNKKEITKEDLLKIQRSAVRKKQVEDGAYDGRFRQRSVPDKKTTYKRKPKHKDDDLTP